MWAERPPYTLQKTRGLLVRFVVLTIASLLASPAFAQAYKCPGNGAVVYQDRPCVGGVQVLSAPAVDPAVDLLNEQPRTAAETEPGAVACRASAPFFKDPDSVRIAPSVIALEPKGKRSPTARRWLISVNAKNSFGGYTGVKTYLCVTTLDGQAVTSVVPWG